MTLKHLGIAVAASLFLALLTVPAASATTTCNRGTLTGTTTCSSTRFINCPGPSQCWVGSFCQAKGTGILSCADSMGATCGPAVNGCTAYGGVYFPPGWSGSWTNTCNVSGYATNVVITCN